MNWTRSNNERAMRGPLAVDEVPGRRSIPPIELDQTGRPKLVVVLDVVPLPRPLGHDLSKHVVGFVRTIRREPDDGHDIGTEVHDSIKVAPLACLLEQDRPAAAELTGSLPGWDNDQSEKAWAVSISQATP